MRTKEDHQQNIGKIFDNRATTGGSVVQHEDEM